MRLAEPRARVMATRVERQWDYFATLSAHYHDQSILMRPVKGVFRQTSHENLRPVYPDPETTTDPPSTTLQTPSSTPFYIPSSPADPFSRTNSPSFSVLGPAAVSQASSWPFLNRWLLIMRLCWLTLPRWTG